MVGNKNCWREFKLKMYGYVCSTEIAVERI